MRPFCVSNEVNSLPLRTLAACLALPWFLAHSPNLESGENTSHRPVTVQTRDGSVLNGWLKTSTSLVLELASGDRKTLSSSQLSRIAVGERGDPKLEDEARRAIEDLHSDQYLKRQKAQSKLKELGRSAVRVLRAAAKDKDVEVATQARQLLAQLAMGGVGAVEDEVSLMNGQMVAGRLGQEHFEVRTRVGLVQFGLASLDHIIVHEEPTAAHAAIPRQAKETAPIPAVPPPPAPGGTLAERISMQNEANAVAMGALPGGVRPSLWLFQLARGSFDPKPKDKVKWKAGDSVEDLYAASGLLIRATSKDQEVVADKDEQILGASKGLNATVDEPKGQGDIELSFIQRGSFDPKTRTGRPGGVYEFGCFIGSAAEATIGLEAYDGTGRRLCRILNHMEGNVLPGGAMGNELMGVRSQVPITKVRIFRVPNRPDTRLKIDDVMFSRITSVRHAPWLACVELQSGDQLIGRLEPSEKKDTIAIAPAFMPPTQSPVNVSLKDLKRLSPPQTRLARSAPSIKNMGSPHAILLQNGELIRACFFKLDKKVVDLRLAGNVRLVLPRGVLRKIDLWPDAEKAESAPKKLSVAKGEKPGVKFRTVGATVKMDKPAPKEPAPPGAVAPPSPAEGLPRMDNAEILSAEFKENELVVDPKDGAGEWPIDLLTAHYLVFPPNPDAMPDRKKPSAWTLILRQGSQFDVELKGLKKNAIVAEFAGGEVVLPLEVVESLQRKTSEE